MSLFKNLTNRDACLLATIAAPFMARFEVEHSVKLSSLNNDVYRKDEEFRKKVTSRTLRIGRHYVSDADLKACNAAYDALRDYERRLEEKALLSAESLLIAAFRYAEKSRDVSDEVFHDIDVLKKEMKIPNDLNSLRRWVFEVHGYSIKTKELLSHVASLPVLARCGDYGTNSFKEVDALWKRALKGNKVFSQKLIDKMKKLKRDSLSNTGKRRRAKRNESFKK